MTRKRIGPDEASIASKEVKLKSPARPARIIVAILMKIWRNEPVPSVASVESADKMKKHLI